MSLFRRKQDNAKALDDDANRLMGEQPENLMTDPKTQKLKEGEMLSFVPQASQNEENVQMLMTNLKNWINTSLQKDRIIVRSLESDLYDGTVLQKLLEHLAGIKINMPEMTQNRDEQKRKLNLILMHINEQLMPNLLNSENKVNKKWDVDSVHSKNLVAILHLLVALAVYFHAPIMIPENVTLSVIVVAKTNGKLEQRTVREEITRDKESMAQELSNTVRHGRGKDAFDTLFEHAIDKLEIVKQELIDFINKHLNKISLELTDIEKQLHDGVYLILLIGLLEGFFVPLYSFNMTPESFEARVKNINLAFTMMKDLNIDIKDTRPEDIANLDLKSTLRITYALYNRYKYVE